MLTAELDVGGARGIGLEVSKALAEAGADVRTHICLPGSIGDSYIADSRNK